MVQEYFQKFQSQNFASTSTLWLTLRAQRANDLAIYWNRTEQLNTTDQPVGVGESLDRLSMTKFSCILDGTRRWSFLFVVS